MRFYDFAIAVGLVSLAACVGGAKKPSDTTHVAVDTSAATTTTTGAAAPISGPAMPPTPGAGISPGAQITPKLIALGDSIFHGKVAGGTCQTCHGADAKGTALAPNLTDNQWLNGDGSYQFIVNTVTTGVPKPKQHPAPMPPKGGAPLTPDQVKAVAAYVYSLSHPGS
jgi:mono/diheme cytochrome c family protein